MKHRFESTGKTITGWSELTMVLEVDQLTSETIGAIPRYLISNVRDLVQQVKKKEYQMFPVVVEVGGAFRISEKVLWNLVVEKVDDSADIVISYIDNLCESVGNDMLFHHDEKNNAGSYALKAYFEFLFDSDKCTDPSASNIYKYFYKYLRHSDLEFETFQDVYIERILDRWILFDKEKPFELLRFRLFYGQNTDKDFRYLHKYLELRQPSGGLKKLIDMIIDSEDDEYIYEECRYESSIYQRLCAAIYGTNKNMIEEVMDYIESRIEGDLEEVDSTTNREILRIQRECDAYREFQKERQELIDSGFHLFDRSKKIWEARNK